jgi:hypothetical protein
LQGHFVHLAYLGQIDEVAARPASIKGMVIDPARRIGVSLHLEVLTEFLVSDGATFGEEGLNLFEDEGVALEGGAVVRFFVPDGPPDAFSLDRAG